MTIIHIFSWTLLAQVFLANVLDEAMVTHLNPLRPRQNGILFADDIYKLNNFIE